MKKFTLMVCAIAIGATLFAQSSITCPSSFKRSNGAGDGCAYGKLTLVFSSCPTFAPIIDSVYHSGSKLNVTFGPGTIYCSGNTFEITYCISANIPPTGFLTIYFQGNASYNGTSCVVPPSGGGGPLPIVLSSFDAMRKGNYVDLTWATSSEINAKEFVLQRKTGTEFIDVAHIEAGANSATGNTYAFRDNNNTKGVTEYRLKMVDLDGSFKYSNIRSVKGIGADQDFTVYPNPSTGTATVVLSADYKKANVRLMDNTGRLIKTENLANSGSTTFRGLAPGMYLISVTNPLTGESVTRKLSVVQ